MVIPAVVTAHPTETLGLVGAIALGLGIRAIGWFAPKIVANKIHELFTSIKDSAWVRDKAHPKRAEWLVATAKLLEEEIPNPGDGKQIYLDIGNALAGSMLILKGTGDKWADALEKIGDAVDLELDADVIELAAKAPCPPK